jgi:hypothetical protein
MSAEPAKAKHEAKDESAAVAITITGNQTSGYGFNPANAIVANLGTVQFIAPQALWVWTFVHGALANVFNGQQSDHVQCGAGGNNNFTVLSQYSNTVITVVGTALNAPPPPPPLNVTEILKGTIHVGN